jgi:hypothetical protein
MTIDCDTEPMVNGNRYMCPLCAERAPRYYNFLTVERHDGMSTCPCLQYLISVSRDDLFGRGHVGRLQRLAGRTFGMHITVATGIAMVRSLRPSPSAPPRPRTSALTVHLAFMISAIVKLELTRPVQWRRFPHYYHYRTPNGSDRARRSSRGPSSAMGNHLVTLSGRIPMAPVYLLLI